MSSQNLFFYYYYLKLEKAPGVIMVRCKSNTHVLLSFLIAGMKQAQRCEVPSGFRTAPFLSHPQTTKKKGQAEPQPSAGGTSRAGELFKLLLSCSTQRVGARKRRCWMSNGIWERKAHLLPLRRPLCEAGLCSFLLLFNK